MRRSDRGDSLHLWLLTPGSICSRELRGFGCESAYSPTKLAGRPVGRAGQPGRMEYVRQHAGFLPLLTTNRRQHTAYFHSHI